MENQRKIPEILAPAGTPEALRAAVNAGCDAVYLGGDLFSARAFAGNFNREMMLEAIDYCHLFGVKLYMTVNTLLKDSEMEQLVPYMQPFYLAGLDGVIVQDPGVVRVLRKSFPDLALHASTQMSVASASGANFLKRQGMVRIVPARELSLEEIRILKEESRMEVETFVHGAMCYAYSGKCLFSSFLGGRSGNRGRCAQPCRKCYSLDLQEQNPGKNAGKGAGKGPGKSPKGYLMSLKDMCTLEILPQLIDAGIDSFKIEGRMKNPSYVAATVDAYRQARDCWLRLQRMCAKEHSYSQAQRSENQMAQWEEPLGSEAPQEEEVPDSHASWREEPLGSEAPQGEEVPDSQASRRKEELRSRLPRWEEVPASVQREYLALAERLTADMQDIYNRGGFHSGYYHTEKGLVMTAVDRPNHAGRRIGSVDSVQGAQVRIHLQEELHAQDVLEIRQTGTELTSNIDGAAGSRVCLKGKDLRRLKPGMDVYRTRNNALLQRIEKDLIGKERTIRAEAMIEAREGKPLAITLRGKNQPSICVQGSVVQPAGSKPVDASQMISKMQKTGGSHVTLTVTCQADDHIFVPMSEFNALRRDAVEQWKQAVCRQYHREDPGR